MLHSVHCVDSVVGTTVAANVSCWGLGQCFKMHVRSLWLCHMNEYRCVAYGSETTCLIGNTCLSTNSVVAT